MPSSRSRCSALDSRLSRMRSPALSWATRSSIESHSGVAYSGWLPTSRYRRAPFSRKTLLLRPQLTTRRNRYRATSSGLSRRGPRRVHVTPYSFSSPKMRLSTKAKLPLVPMQQTRMVRLATVGTSFHARVIAARLGSEGILTDLRGNVDGFYPVGVVHVFVDQEDLEDAQEILMVDDVESAFDEPDDVPEAGTPPALWLVFGAILAMAAVIFSRTF